MTIKIRPMDRNIIIDSTVDTPSFTGPKFIILEGCDRTGKSSMQDEIDKQTKYKHFVLDRGPIGFKAYCEIFNKDQKLFNSYNKSEEEFLQLSNILVIYLDCSTEILIERCLKTNHEILDFNHHKKIYKKYYDQSKLNKIKVDTTEKHVSEIVKELINQGVL